MAATFEAFVFAYFANGFNATAAYRAVHPRVSQRTAETQGSEYLRKPEVQRIVAEERNARRRQLQMDADQAIERLTRIGRVDIRKFFRSGQVIPLEQLPEEVTEAVKTFKVAPDGAVTIQLSDKLRALELLAINAGKIRVRSDRRITFDHAAYLGDQPPAGDDE
jgi:hypothetical protein